MRQRFPHPFLRRAVVVGEVLVAVFVADAEVGEVVGSAVPLDRLKMFPGRGLRIGGFEGEVDGLVAPPAIFAVVGAEQVEAGHRGVHRGVLPGLGRVRVKRGSPWVAGSCPFARPSV